jgi:hypothetical protein
MTQSPQGFSFAKIIPLVEIIKPPIISSMILVVSALSPNRSIEKIITQEIKI